MSKKQNKLEPNWDIIKPNMIKNSSTATNKAYQDYGKAIMDFISLSGFDVEDGIFYQYAGTQEKVEQKANAFETQIEKHQTIMKAVAIDDRETLLAILEGRFFKE